MTIQDLDPRITYSGTGSVTKFTFAFEAVEEDDIMATVDGVDTFPYTVTFNADQDSNPGGDVDFDEAPLAGTLVAIYRATDFTQETAYPDYARFPAASHEAALDKLTMIVQEIWDSLTRLWTRAMIFPETNPLDNTVPTVDDRKNKYFYWDADGNPAVASGTDGGAGGDCSIPYKVKEPIADCGNSCDALNKKWLDQILGIGVFCDGETVGEGVEVGGDIGLQRTQHGVWVDARGILPDGKPFPKGLTVGLKISHDDTQRQVVVASDEDGRVWVYHTLTDAGTYSGDWYQLVSDADLSSKADLNGNSTEKFSVLSPDDENGVYGTSAINQIWLANHLGIGYVGGPSGTYLSPDDDADLASYLQMAFVGIGSTNGFPAGNFRGFKCADVGTPIDLIGIDIGTGQIWTYTSPTGEVGSWDGVWKQTLSDAPDDVYFYARKGAGWQVIIDGDEAVGNHEIKLDPHPQYITAEDLPSNIVDWFTNNANPLAGGYLLLANEDTGEAESSIAVVCTTQDVPVLIGEWLREDNFTFDFEWFETSTTFDIIFESDQENAEIFIEIYSLKLGVEELMATTGHILLEDVKQGYTFQVPIQGPINMNTGDNIVTKVWANKRDSGLDPTVTIYMEDFTESRMLTRIPLVATPGPHAVTHESGSIDQIDHNNLMNAIGQLTHAQIDASLDTKIEAVLDDPAPVLAATLTANVTGLGGPLDEIIIDVQRDGVNFAKIWKSGVGIFSIGVDDGVDRAGIEFLMDDQQAIIYAGDNQFLIGSDAQAYDFKMDDIEYLGVLPVSSDMIQVWDDTGGVQWKPYIEEPTIALVDATRPFEYTANNTSFIPMLFERLDEETDSSVVRQNPTNDARFDFLEAGLYKGYVTFYVVGAVEWAYSINGSVDSETIERNGFSSSTENYKITVPFSFRVNANDYLQFEFRKWGGTTPVIQPYATIFIQKKAD